MLSLLSAEQVSSTSTSSLSPARTRKGRSNFSRKTPRVGTARWFVLIPPADDERVVLIDQALEFRFGSLDGHATFAWADLSGDDGDLWEFVCSKVRHCYVVTNTKAVGVATSKMFETTLLQCVYERVSYSYLLGSLPEIPNIARRGIRGRSRSAEIRRARPSACACVEEGAGCWSY